MPGLYLALSLAGLLVASEAALVTSTSSTLSVSPTAAPTEVMLTPELPPTAVGFVENWKKQGVIDTSQPTCSEDWLTDCVGSVIELLNSDITCEELEEKSTEVADAFSGCASTPDVGLVIGVGGLLTVIVGSGLQERGIILSASGKSQCYKITCAGLGLLFQIQGYIYLGYYEGAAAGEELEGMYVYGTLGLSLLVAGQATQFCKLDNDDVCLTEIGIGFGVGVPTHAAGGLCGLTLDWE